MKRIITRKPTFYEEELCMLFAENCIETNIDEYRRRNQLNLEKIVNDIYHGKLAEVLVHDYVSNLKACSSPDFMIYEARRKSFDADLSTDTANIHVKSCIQSRHSNSWVFQPNDPVVINPSEKDSLALFVFGVKNNYFYLTKAVDVVYEEPRSKKLNKKVIYEKWS